MSYVKLLVSSYVIFRQRGPYSKMYDMSLYRFCIIRYGELDRLSKTCDNTKILAT